MTREEALKVAKPILFNTDMVRAIQNGTKTVTRRIAFPNKDLHEFRSSSYPEGWWYRGNVAKSWSSILHHIKRVNPCKYEVGDILYVRETWCKGSLNYGEEQYFYKADGIIPHCTWSPSIHMPKEAARIFLQVTDVRVERLQDCDNMQAKDEGCTCCSQFARIWDSTIKKSDLDKYGWSANPWVWVIEFERLEIT